MRRLNIKNIAILASCLCLGGSIFALGLKAEMNKVEIQKLTKENSELRDTNEGLNNNNKDLTRNLKDVRRELGNTYQKEDETKLIKGEQLHYQEETIDYSGYDIGEFTATFYDVSTDGSEWGNITAYGFDLTGHTLESARAIAVDPSVIPLGTQVYLEFADGYEFLNGTYTAVDTGGAIQGSRIDVFAEGYDINSLGVTSVNISIL